MKKIISLIFSISMIFAFDINSPENQEKIEYYKNILSVNEFNKLISSLNSDNIVAEKAEFDKKINELKFNRNQIKRESTNNSRNRDRTVLVIDLYDSYGDYWTGNSGLEFEPGIFDNPEDAILNISWWSNSLEIVSGFGYGQNCQIIDSGHHAAQCEFILDENIPLEELFIGEIVLYSTGSYVSERSFSISYQNEVLLGVTGLDLPSYPFDLDWQNTCSFYVNDNILLANDSYLDCIDFDGFIYITENYFGDACANINCDDGNLCTEDFCEDGSCFFINVDGFACDDGNSCTASDTCSDGVCIGTAFSCDDGIGCTVDICDSQGGCIHNPDDSVCDDGLYCNGTEYCSANIGCESSAPIDCDDQENCTSDVCDEEADICTNIIDESLLDCDGICEGDAVEDECGVCGGDGSTCDTCANINCDDGNLCTEDFCEDGSCFFINVDGFACDDGNSCTASDTCSDGVCIGTAFSCDDGIGCTVDICDSQGGCIHNPDDSVCDDGLYCNGTEYCSANIGCESSAPIDCDDQENCTSDVCDEEADICTNIIDEDECGVCGGDNTSCDRVLVFDLYDSFYNTWDGNVGLQFETGYINIDWYTGGWGLYMTTDYGITNCIEYSGYHAQCELVVNPAFELKDIFINDFNLFSTGEYKRERSFSISYLGEVFFGASAENWDFSAEYDWQSACTFYINEDILDSNDNGDIEYCEYFNGNIWFEGNNFPIPDCFSGVYDCAGVCDGTAVEDCTGTCGGTAVNDACGVCGGDNLSCSDCAGIPNGDTVEDCAGICGGGAIEDECGVCGGDNSSCIDCNGTPNGTAVEDECGVCGGNSNPLDCNNDGIDDICEDEFEAGFFEGQTTGDLNQDGVVNVVDIVQLVNNILGQ